MNSIHSDIPISVSSALNQMERTERLHKILSYAFLCLVVILPFAALLTPKGINGYELFVVIVLLYNTLFIMWIKQDVNANAARVFRVLTHLRQEMKQSQGLEQ